MPAKLRTNSFKNALLLQLLNMIFHTIHSNTIYTLCYFLAAGIRMNPNIFEYGYLHIR